MDNIFDASAFLNFNTGDLEGKNVSVNERKFRDLKGVFKDEEAFYNKDSNEVIYYTHTQEMVKEGKEGGLFYCTSFVNPGKVGNEYYMTKGHFHSKRDTGEYYICLKGEGVLILMDENSHTYGEILKKGSLHYIPGNVAHRLSNTGDEKLVVLCIWPSEAGHDYKSILESGFSRRLVEKKNGKPVLE